MRTNRARLATTMLAAAALLGGSALTMGVAPAGASTLGGTATIANPANNQPLASGGSTTSYTVTLPSGAACDGDTANGGYHVYSYLVQAGTNITSVTFNNFPSQGYGFLDNTGTYYGPANTAINTGQVISIPTNFQWGPLVVSDGGVLALSDLLYSGTSGVWEAGLVCANSSGHVADYWNTEITFSASGSDANGFTWAGVPGVPTQAPEAPIALMLPVVGVAAAVFAVMRRRRRQHLEIAAVDAA